MVHCACRGILSSCSGFSITNWLSFQGRQVADGVFKIIERDSVTVGMNGSYGHSSVMIVV
jgi:hypothetical protein